jgi:hypothetical protein
MIDDKGNTKKILPETCNKTKNLRMIYFMSYQESRIILKKESDLQKDIGSLTQLLHISNLQDRNKMIDILKRFSNNIKHKSYPDMTTEKLSNLLDYLSQYKYYAICIYPHGEPSISLTQFTPDEVISKINISRSGYGVQIWFCEDILT